MAIDRGKDKGIANPETTQGDAPEIWGGEGGCLPGPGPAPGPAIPSPFPPKPTVPAMTIAFKFALGEVVQISHNSIQGSIVAAAVTFNETTNLYLIDIGRDEGKWYPESMLKPLPVYYTGLRGPTDSPATKMSGGEETGDRPKE